MTETPDNQDPRTVSVALCVDGEAYTRLHRVLRNLVIGLIDHAVNVQLICPDERIQELSFGPIRTVVHQPVTWLSGNRRIAKVLEMLAPSPPTMVHAVSVGSYELASAIAEVYEADLVIQVTSLADCEGLAQVEDERVGAYLPFSLPLAQVLREQFHTSAEKTELIRPGVLASQEIACYSSPNRRPTLLCTTDFDKHGGVDRLIDAARILRERGRDLLVFLLGTGPQEANLRRRVNNKGMSSYITFARPWGDPADAMNSSDIYVRPADNGTFLVNPLQAMGVGMAVVAHPCGVSDYLRDGETALLDSGSTAEATADLIDTLLTDRAFAKRLATTGRDFVRTYHPMSGMADRTAAVYRKLDLAHATFPLKE